PVLDNPFQLPVGITLHLFRSQRGNRRGQTGCERHAGILSVEAMAHEAVMLKRGLAVSQGLEIIVQRVANLLSFHGEVLLGPLRKVRFRASWRGHAATGEHEERRAGREQSDRSYHLQFPVTCTSIAICPWPDPQNLPHWPWKSPASLAVNVTSAGLP